ncbi:hypothetical protein KIPB_013868 [Kipferlia bialata]|uniref:Helicase-associated domain-containing protein n=1 Tax=Kipferlia bialata TaxID=797122 RepID=A0A391P1L6_9EUKA|nr:hypothetical protein KIPB_013868 [Kipferlia bialata]|eukprot:g13868.t1
MTKSKVVSTGQHESSEEDAEDSEETALESDVLMDGESEESAWEETESEYESEEGEGSESESHILIQDAVTVPTLGSVGVAIGDARASCASGHGRPFVTGHKHVESGEVDPIKGRRASLLDAKWKAKLEELRAYLDVHGVWPPKRSGTLGEWVHKQRFDNKKNRLPQWRVDALEGLGINWSPRGPQTKWCDRLAELKKYRSANGSWPSMRSGPLGRWVDKQRVEYRQGKLSAERVAALDEVSFDWNPGAARR